MFQLKAIYYSTYVSVKSYVYYGTYVSVKAINIRTVCPSEKLYSRVCSSKKLYGTLQYVPVKS